jgi:hypothetical protein
MVMLRRVPRRTDVNWGGYKFEVIDVDSYRIDQVLVSRLSDDGKTPLPPPRQRPKLPLHTGVAHPRSSRHSSRRPGAKTRPQRA